MHNFVSSYLVTDEARVNNLDCHVCTTTRTIQPYNIHAHWPFNRTREVREAICKMGRKFLALSTGPLSRVKVLGISFWERGQLCRGYNHRTVDPSKAAAAKPFFNL